MEAEANRWVLVIASGSTEREALPRLLRVSVAEHGHAIDVRFPPRNQALTAEMAARLIKAGFWGSYPRPHKTVVLCDCDSDERAEVERRLRKDLAPLVAGTTQQGLYLIVTGAKWHLEAWFFGDPGRLAASIGRDLGTVDITNPDAIDNPKRHLTNLLDSVGRIYTAQVAGELGGAVDPQVVRQRSSSFSDFAAATENGGS